MSPAYRVTDAYDPSLRPLADVGDYEGVTLKGPPAADEAHQEGLDTAEARWLVGYLTALVSRGAREDRTPVSAHPVVEDGSIAPYFQVRTERGSYRVTVEPEAEAA